MRATAESAPTPSSEHLRRQGPALRIVHVCLWKRSGLVCWHLHHAPLLCCRVGRQFVLEKLLVAKSPRFNLSFLHGGVIKCVCDTETGPHARQVSPKGKSKNGRMTSEMLWKKATAEQRDVLDGQPSSFAWMKRTYCEFKFHLVLLLSVSQIRSLSPSAFYSNTSLVTPWR